MSPVVRFAPSPTGRIHVGNARPALMNWCYAKRAGGRFILRFDDTDRERSTQAFADAILVDLDWLGIKPDLVVRQSDRFALYDAAADRLRAMGRLYPCYESEDELDRRRKRQQARGLPPVYDRAALKLTADERAALAAEGRRPHWRFLLEHRQVTWHDGVRGEAHVDTASLSDPVLIRADGAYLYTLPSVVDDIDLGITDVIRGEDHVTNTAVQIEIFEALGARPPRFAHHNLLVSADDAGLSKRTGALSIGSLRDAGLEPMTVVSLAVLVGTSEAVRPVHSLDELANLLDLSKVSRSPARFDPSELEVLNAKLLHETPYAAIADRLDASEAFWMAVRGNLRHFSDVERWRGVVTGDPPRHDGDEALREVARRLLPPEPWTEATWADWTSAIASATGLKGKALFLPLRLALTGEAQGPELKALLPLIGRARVLARL